MPYEELEGACAAQLNPTAGTPAKDVRLALGALLMTQRLGLTDEETVEQSCEHDYETVPFNPSMMVRFCQPCSEQELGPGQ